MADKFSKQRRRWFQFSLRSLFVLVTVVVVLLALWRVFVEPYRVQRAVMSVLEDLDASYTTKSGPAWVARLIWSDDVQVVVSVNLVDASDPNQYLEHLLRLRELETLLVGGPKFRDEHLDRIGRMKSLRRLVLDSTGVSRQRLDALRARRPELTVFRSERRAIALLKERGAFVETKQHKPTDPIQQLVDETHHSVAVLVYARGAKISDADLEFIGTMLELKLLRLGGTGISDNGLSHLNGLLQLESLDLKNTNVSDESLRHLAGIGSLKALWLDGTGVTDYGLVRLTNLTKLIHLDLRHTKVTDAGLKKLMAIEKLETLYLHETLVTQRGITELKRERPEISVVD